MLTTSSRSTQDLPRLRRRDGFAMALALGAIVVIGMLIAGVYFTTGQQISAGRTATSREQAFRVAEAGLAQSLSSWDAAVVKTNTATPGQSHLLLTKAAMTLPPGITVHSANVRVTNLNNTLYQVKSVADVGNGSGRASREVSQLIRMLSTTFNVLGALTVKGTTKIGGSSLINGYDTNPLGWSCSAPGAAKPGIAIGSASNISTSGCGSLSCVEGSPKVQETPLADNMDTYEKFGDATWASLVAQATLTMTYDPAPAPAYLNGACNRSVLSNWGDVNRMIPAGKCESYFPIVYFPGDAKLTGGTGQGVLLVGGDLEVQGGFKFFGPVIVRGRLKTAGTGGHFNGAVMAANVELEENSILGNAVVNYSNCAIEQAIKNIPQPPVPVQHRAWAESF